MAVFFIIGGFFLKDATMGNIIPFLKKKAKSLWLPLAAYVVFATLFHNLFVAIGFLSSAPYGLMDIAKQLFKILVGAGYDYLYPLWFVRTMLYAFVLLSILSYVLNRVVKDKTNREYARCTIILVMAFAANVMSMKLGVNFDSVNNAFTALWLIYMGYGVRNIIKIEFSSKWVFSICVVTAYYLSVMYGSYNINKNIFSDVVTLTVVSFSYLYIVCYVSRRIEGLAAARLVAVCGRYSYHLMALHPLAFKVCTYTLLALGSPSTTLVLSQPHPMCNGNAPLVVVYLVFGLVLPIFTIFILKNILSKIKCIIK